MESQDLVRIPPLNLHFLLCEMGCNFFKMFFCLLDLGDFYSSQKTYITL